MKIYKKEGCDENENAKKIYEKRGVFQKVHVSKTRSSDNQFQAFRVRIHERPMQYGAFISVSSVK
jgi:arsenate reductase-like glutaredoxin family protein